jgi:hypothetical protein
MVQNETIKIWLLSMFTTELDDIKGSIRNYNLWKDACNNPEEIPAYEEAIENMHDYAEILQKCITSVEGGTFNVD